MPQNKTYLDKIIQGVLLFPSLGGWKNILFGTILVEGVILFSLRDRQTDRQTKKQLCEMEWREQEERFPEAHQI